jgi:PAS domain S-box-containing protein
MEHVKVKNQHLQLRSQLDELKAKYLKLSENEQHYKRLVEGAPDISYIYGTKTGAKYWSPQVEDILGISPSQLIEDPFAWFNAIHDEDKEKVKELFKSLKRNNSSFSIEYRIKDQKGNWRWLNDRTISVQKEKNEYIILGLAQDITNRKKIEQELKLSEELFRKAFVTSPDAININRLHDGLYISINNGFTNIMGYSETEVVGKTSLELNIWQHASDRQRLLELLIKEGHADNLEANFIAKNGEIKKGLMSATIIELGGEKNILSITRDISERESIHHALLKNQYYLEKAQDLGKIGTWEMDLLNENLFWTDETYIIFGIPVGTPLNLKRFLECVHPEDRDAVIKSWKAALQGEIYDIEHRIIRDNEIQWVREKADIEFDAKKKPIQAIGIVQDITERKNIEEALKESEEKYRLIVEHANDGIEITQDDKIIYSNARFANMLGYTQEEITNVSFCQIFSDDAKIYLNQRQKNRQQGKHVLNHYETTFLTKNNDVLNVEINYQIIEFKGKPATFAIIRDITESKEMEFELRKLSTAVEQSPSQIVITDLNGIFEYVNPKFTEITGYSQEDVEGECPRILKSCVLPLDMYKELWDTILSGKTWKGEFLNIKKNGEKYWENAAITPIVDKEGNPTHFLKVAEDITEWKNIEEALRQSEEKYRLLVENANDGIIISQEDQFIYTNARFAQIMGYNHDELNKISFKAIYTKQGIKDLYERNIKRINGEVLPNYYQTTFRKKNGVIIQVDVNYQIIYYKNKPATFAIIRDITKQKEAERALLLALEKAEESDRLKSAFLANMSHEIRTPMNGIMGFSKLLRKKDLSSDKRDMYLNIIDQSSQRMLNIINDLIDISKIESGQMKVDLKETNINDIIKYMFNFFEPECLAKNIKLKIKHPLMDDKAVIHTDQNKLEAILINLLKNAIKFTDKGSIECGYEENGHDLMFYVKDTGIGIPENKTASIFDRFVQADSSMSKPYEGAGLGLSISKAFVEMLGGNLEVSSEFQKGSTFFFSIPYSSIDHYTAKVSLHEPKKKKIQPSLKHGINILIAEDDEPSYMYLNILLAPYAKHVIRAKNGKEAVEMFEANPDIDLILMDIKMPVMDGYEATSKIRTLNTSVIIIAQTAYAFSDDREKIIKSGCNDYLPKPVREDKIAELIAKYFKKS